MNAKAFAETVLVPKKMFYEPFKRQLHKLIKHIQTIRRQMHV